MKADVITLHSVANYGTQLQALATQEKLKEYFDEVEFIDYRRPDTYGLNLMKTFSRGNFLRALAILPTMLVWKYRFGRFQKKYLHLSKNTYLTQADLNKFQDNADYYIVGSDQVWNSGWNNGVIKTYYLDFVDSRKPKFSFSSSFGQSRLGAEEASEVRDLLSGFQTLSVREPSAVQIVKNQLGIDDVTQLVDPVLSLPAEYWRRIATGSVPKEKYILIYSLNRNYDLDMYAKALSRHTGIGLVRFCTRLDQVFRPGTARIIPNILDFINLIDHAVFVITDSFHATAFSMLLNTPPICIYPEKYSSRISEFLKLTDSESRHLSSYNDFDIIKQPMDFSRINTILKAKREQVDLFLKRAVSLDLGDRNE